MALGMALAMVASAVSATALEASAASAASTMAASAVWAASEASAMATVISEYCELNECHATPLLITVAVFECTWVRWSVG